jgi:hypothetical protein
MTAVSLKQRLPSNLEKIKKLKGVLVKCGNKERTNTFLVNLYASLKQAKRNKFNDSKYPLSFIAETTPLSIINRCLYNLMPAFVLRRIIRAGKSFELPVPISDNHAVFRASYWLIKATIKNNKNALSLPSLLTQEICATLYNEGAALDYLKSYIEIAIDQRPFMRYIKKKRKVKSRSKKTYAARCLRKLYRKPRLRYRTQRDRFKRALIRRNSHTLRRYQNHIKTKKRFLKKPTRKKLYHIKNIKKQFKYRKKTSVLLQKKK